MIFIQLGEDAVGRLGVLLERIAREQEKLPWIAASLPLVQFQILLSSQGTILMLYVMVMSWWF